MNLDKTSFNLNGGFDIKALDIIQDQNAAYDEMLEKHPVVRNKDGRSYTVFVHEDVMKVIGKGSDELFSAKASKYLFVPHGLDNPEHSLYRMALAEAFTDEKMRPLLSKYREIAADLVDEMIEKSETVDIQDFAFYYTARLQLALLNWDQSLDKVCIDWTKSNLKATFEENIDQNIENARIWNELVFDQLNTRRKNISSGLRTNLPNDTTDDLLNVRVNGKPMPDEEIASLLRNLNMGLISSLACNIGNCIHFFAENKDIQSQVRDNLDLLPEALDEITRLHGCLVSSKRVAKFPVEIRGVSIKAGEQVHVNWCSANRDGDVFSEPKMFKWGRDHSKHIMYGAGPHECMGIQLARVQLQIAIEELFSKTIDFDLDNTIKPTKIVFPANGYMTLPVQLHHKEINEI